MKVVFPLINAHRHQQSSEQHDDGEDLAERLVPLRSVNFFENISSIYMLHYIIVENWRKNGKTLDYIYKHSMIYWVIIWMFG